MPGRKKLQVIGLGLATLDILIRLREMPEWDSHNSFSNIAIDGGGPAATAMAAAARLGLRAGFIGTYGSDNFGTMKMKSLTDNKVDISRAVKRPDEHSVMICYVNRDSGERIFCPIEHFRDNELKPEELDRDYIRQADYLHLDGSHIQAALQAAKWMRAAGKKVVFDGAKGRRAISGNIQKLISLTDIAVCGSGFAQSLTGKEDLYEAGQKVPDYGPEIYVQTEGENGCYTFCKGDYFHTPAQNVAVMDTTGAGDVFHGAYITGLIKKWDLRHIARFANAAAALKCTKMGGRAGIPLLNETEQFIAGTQKSGIEKGSPG